MHWEVCSESLLDYQILYNKTQYFWVGKQMLSKKENAMVPIIVTHVLLKYILYDEKCVTFISACWISHSIFRYWYTRYAFVYRSL